MKKINFKGSLVTPSKLICIAKNYSDEIRDSNRVIPSSMVIFLKPNSSITDKLYSFEDIVFYECEICFMIKDSEIVGAALGLDLTKKELQNELKKVGLPWERAKAFDHSAVLSHFVEIDGFDKLSFELYINDELRQSACVNDMIYRPLMILDEISSFMSFEDYDIIMSGTPKGVGVYKKGDIFRAKLYQDGEVIIEQSWEVI